MRNLILRHERQYNKQYNAIQRWINNIVSFEEPDSVIQRSGSGMNEKWENSPSTVSPTYLENPVHLSTVLKFLGNNRRYLEDVPWNKRGYVAFNADGRRRGVSNDDFDKLRMEEDLEYIGIDSDYEIVEFDDEFEREELLFSVTVDNKLKRITVIFRGSENVSDWKANFDIRLSQIEMLGEEHENIRAHSGYYQYLFGQSASGRVKFQQIMDVLKKLHNNPQYSDYSLFTTGWSLGGALASLAGFVLSSLMETETSFFKGPVTMITFGSPPVGNRAYEQKFQEMEKEGKLFYIRVSTNEDLVPRFGDFAGRLSPFVHNGINMNVHQGSKMDIGRGNLWEGETSIEFHYLFRYLIGLQHEDNKAILAMSVEEIYKNYG